MNSTNLEEQLIYYKYTYGILNTPINTYSYALILPQHITEFTYEMIHSFLLNDKADLTQIDSIKYLNTIKGGYIEIRQGITYPMPHNLTLLLHIKDESSERSTSELEKQVTDLEMQLDHYQRPLNPFNSLILESSSSFGLSHTSSTANDQTKDLIYLYACPIVKQITNSDSYCEFIEQIDYQNEIEKICNSISQTKKSFNAVFEAADFDMLTNSIRKFPKILHISSHGITREERGIKYFHLCLEKEGVLSEVREDRIKSILSQDERLSTIDLVIISACHSEALGKIFYDAGIHNVICVQGMTKISDEAAQSFASNLYQYLINGSTIKDAFNKSKQLFRNVAFQGDLQECCCNHQHKSECCFDNLSQSEKTEYHHTHHIKKCECYFPEYHTHKEGCKALMKTSRNAPIKSSKSGNVVKICCCSPDIAHNESNKFILMGNGGTVIFPSLIQGSLGINMNCFRQCPLYKHRKIKLIGRNIEMKNLMQMLTKCKNRAVIIYGKKGAGKTSFVKYASIYFFERKLFKNVYFVDFIRILCTFDMIIERIKEQVVDHNQKNLVILSFSNLQEEFFFCSIKEIISQLLQEFPSFTYLIMIHTAVSSIKFETVFDGNEYSKLKIEPLQSEWAEMLLKNLTYEYNNIKLFTPANITNIIKNTEGYPNEIFLMAHLIQECKGIEQINALYLERIKDMEKIRYEIIKSINNTDMSNKFFFILSTLPKGISESELNLIDPKYTTIVNTKLVISFNKGKTNEKWYKLISAFIPQVRSISKDEIKQECIYQIVKMLSIVFLKELKILKMTHVSNSIEFNAVNSQGMWLSLNPSKYKELYANIGQIEDNNIRMKYLNKHRYNIEYLIECNKSLIQEIIKNNDTAFIECFEQMSILQPTIFMLKDKRMECIEIIKYFISLCSEFNLILAKNRLTLFLKSIDYHQNFNPETTFPLSKECQAEGYFLKGIKLFDNKEQKQETINCLQKAYDLFLEINSQYNLAKVSYSFASYYKDKIKKLCSSKEYYEKAIKHSLSSSNNSDILLKSYLMLANIELEHKNYAIANDYAEKAKNVSITNKLPIEETKANHMIEIISTKINNSFMILSANQLIDHKGSPLPFEPNSAYYIQQSLFEKLNKIIRLNHVILTKDNITKALASSSGLALVLTSDDFNSKCDLISVNDKGQSEPLPKEVFMKELRQKTIKYRIVILGFINSTLMHKDFIEKSIPHIISFDPLDRTVIQNHQALISYHSLVSDFIIHFLENVLETSVEEAFIKAKKTFINGILRLDSFIPFKYNNFISIVSQSSAASYFIYDKEELNEGKPIISRPFIKFPLLSSTKMYERNKELYDLTQMVISHQVVNIYGEFASGKTLLTVELCKFFYLHDKFKDGIYFIENKDKKQRVNDVIKSITKNDGDILIVIDKNEKMIKKAKKQPIKFPEINHKRIHVVMISREAIQGNQIKYFQLDSSEGIVNRLANNKAMSSKIGTNKKNTEPKNPYVLNRATSLENNYTKNGNDSTGKKKKKERTQILQSNIKSIFGGKYGYYKYDNYDGEHSQSPYIQMQSIIHDYSGDE